MEFSEKKEASTWPTPKPLARRSPTSFLRLTTLFWWNRIIAANFVASMLWHFSQHWKSASKLWVPIRLFYYGMELAVLLHVPPGALFYGRPEALCPMRSGVVLGGFESGVSSAVRSTRYLSPWGAFDGTEAVRPRRSGISRRGPCGDAGPSLPRTGRGTRPPAKRHHGGVGG